ACTWFAAWMVETAYNHGLAWFPLSPAFPQDQTNWVAVWAVVCGLFTIAVVLLGFIINLVINQIRYKEQAKEHKVHNPFRVAKINSAKNFFETLLLAVMIVTSLYIVLYLNWAIFMTDFRIWTLAFKVFDVPMMLPTMVRYAFFFAVWWILSGIANQTYRFKNLPEWATIAINAFFAVAGITIYVAIQYGTFRATGVLWKPTMSLAYIALFPLIPVFIFGAIISRKLYDKTGNIWLGSLVNTLLWTIFTVAGGAASFAYIFG
ncbi:MAG: hypothetical protein NTV44_04730, partial [Firmicutes bacterium]|nr:hypothetical protein [Bacillota bacterium]